MNRWLYIKYKNVIDTILDDIGPDKYFTSGSVEGPQAKGRAMKALQKSGDVICTGYKKATNAKVYKVTPTQYKMMEDIRRRSKGAENQGN